MNKTDTFNKLYSSISSITREDQIPSVYRCIELFKIQHKDESSYKILLNNLLVKEAALEAELELIH